MQLCVLPLAVAALLLRSPLHRTTSSKPITMTPPADYMATADAPDEVLTQMIFETLTTAMKGILSKAEDRFGFQAGEGLRLNWMRDVLFEMDLASLANRLPAAAPSDSDVTTNFARAPAVDCGTTQVASRVAHLSEEGQSGGKEATRAISHLMMSKEHMTQEKELKVRQRNTQAQAARRKTKGKPVCAVSSFESAQKAAV